MEHETDKKLETLIHQELARLPDLKAPETLVPRVLEAIRKKAHPQWWQQPWFGWPLALRVVSLASVGVLLGLVFSGALMLWQDTPQYVWFESVREWFAPLVLLREIAGTLANAVLVILNAIGKFWLCVSLGVVFMAYVSFVGIGTVCVRLAINKR